MAETAPEPLYLTARQVADLGPRRQLARGKRDSQRAAIHLETKGVAGCDARGRGPA